MGRQRGFGSIGFGDDGVPSGGEDEEVYNHIVCIVFLYDVMGMYWVKGAGCGGGALGRHGLGLAVAFCVCVICHFQCRPFALEGEVAIAVIL